MNDHFNPETLAEHAEGLLAPAAAAAAETHLAGCEQCRRTYDYLVALPGLLSADDPGPMPPAVAARIDAVLVSELAGAATVDLSAERAHRARSRRWLQVGSVAAGIAVLGAGAVLGGQLVANRGSVGGADSASAPEAAPGAAKEAGPTPAHAAAGPPITASGRTYTAAGLPGQVRLLIPPPMRAQARDTEELRATQLDGLALSSGELARCVAALGEGAATPLAADTGTWTKRPALVVVLPAPDPKQVTVYVVDPACTTGTADVLHHAEVPRP
jgi:anti-sigma factor RsiW